MSFQQPNDPICPICNNDGLSHSLYCLDYALTTEKFEIMQCPICTLQLTFPKPLPENLATYYRFKNYISHTDTKKGWMNKIYHTVRQFTLSQKTNWIQSLFPNNKGTILEIGGGTGAFSNAMKNIGWEVTGLEPDENSRNISLENYQIKLFPIEHLDSLPDNSFDLITLWHVLEHVTDLNSYFDTFKKLLKKNGRLIIAVPNYTSFDAQYYKSFWAAYDVPRHLFHFSPKSIQQICKRHEFEVIETKPMWFDSFYVSLLSEQYKKSGYFGSIRALIIGVISNLIALINPQKASSVIYLIKHRTI
jgi:SAM-dependent methyltransferase